MKGSRKPNFSLTKYQCVIFLLTVFFQNDSSPCLYIGSTRCKLFHKVGSYGMTKKQIYTNIHSYINKRVVSILITRLIFLQKNCACAKFVRLVVTQRGLLGSFNVSKMAMNILKLMFAWIAFLFQQCREISIFTGFCIFNAFLKVRLLFNVPYSTP